MQDLINRCDALIENKVYGRLIVEVDNKQVYLLSDVEQVEIKLNPTHQIELVIEKERHIITFDQAINTLTPEGWATYAGFDCMIKLSDM